MKKILLLIADILIGACLAYFLWLSALNQEFYHFLTSSALSVDMSLPISKESSEAYLDKISAASAESGAFCDRLFRNLPYYQRPDQNDIESLITPIDLHYYSSPGASDPVLIIPKGTEILITTLYGGYGYDSFPTAKRGWRLANPFQTEKDAGEYQGPYYIRMKELQTLLDDYIRHCKAVLGDSTMPYSYRDWVQEQISTTGVSLSLRSTVHYLLVSRDVQLLQLRDYRSQDLFYPVPALWIMILLCVLYVAANAAIITKRKKSLFLYAF